MPPVYVCHCTFRGCGNDPNGVTLSCRVYKDHQAREEKYQQGLNYLKLQREAIERQEDRIALELDNISPSDPIASFSSFTREAKYRADHKKRLIDNISLARRDVQALLKDITSIGKAPINYPPAHEIEHSLHQCSEIRKSVEQPSRVLHTAQTSALRKEPSIIAMREALHTDIDELVSLTNDIERSWIAASVERQEYERLRQGKSDYNTARIVDGGRV
ncbi:hypothetical protein JR316_0012552 [Psilocybe cubensis]|uniref:Uncharacterized protein n=3 Tax=Psilocybe cubensis TaxID=181762 RepID=A0ACB8GIS7_PSICU|nr:hypothetical protein JR316_0012549 [Psilocybe cubensis]XP_047743066.1 hypothetical protein JR316_0012552 [Psilocybe cubensis]KAH9475438.1 hypothetical protein JR316_0012549 [Psilocybe cubensis]KAH9475441.1 hypothetical protein JR316_0012552 [Psilocybe cubensis]